MKSITTKQAIASFLATGLWAVETWFLVHAAGYSFTPSVVAIPFATACLAFLPFIIEAKDVQGWVRLATFLGFGFLAATVVASVVERTGGAIDAQVSQARSATEARKLLETELATAKQRLSDADAEVARESRAGGCKATCEKWRQTARERQDRVTKLTEELRAMPAYVTGDSVAYRLAKMSGLSEETITLWRPVTFPLGCMICIWSLAAYGFRREHSAPAPVQAITERPKGEPLDPEIEELAKLLAKCKRPLTVNEVAEAMGVVKSEASKRKAKAIEAGVVTERIEGRNRYLSLVH